MNTEPPTKKRAFRKIVRFSLFALPILLILLVVLGIIAYRYVNYEAPSEKELAARIQELRTALQPDFPPEDDRRELYEAFIKKIDGRLVDIVERHHNDKKTHEQSGQKKNAYAITTDNVSEYDAFCEGVDALMQQFEKVLERPSFQMLHNYDLRSGIEWDDDLARGIKQYQSLLLLRQEIAVVKGEAAEAITCFRHSAELAIDISYHGDWVLQLLGFAFTIPSRKHIAKLASTPAPTDDQFQSILKITARLREKLVSSETLFYPYELGVLTVEDLSGIDGADENFLQRWIMKFMLPGTKGVVMNTFRIYRKYKHDPQRIKDKLSVLLQSAKEHYNMPAVAVCMAFQDPEPFYRPKCLFNGFTIVITLNRHKVKHGTYPETLGAIDKELLPEVPHDPYTGRPYIYKKENGGYRLYSTGIDKVDNGGTARPAGAADSTNYDILIHPPEGPS